MKRIGSLFQKDIVLGIKNIFVIMELAFAVFIALLLLFIIPEDLKTEPLIFIHNSTEVAQSIGNEAEAEETGRYYVDSREEVVIGMEENRNALGMIISQQDDGQYQVEFLTQPNTSEQIVWEMEREMSDLLAITAQTEGTYPPDVFEEVAVTALQSGVRDSLPFNKRIMPAVLMMMVGILGLFAMISLVGQERSDQTIRAYRATPASLWEFIISKHLVILVTGLGSFLILYLPLIGWQGLLYSLMIIILTIIMGSSIGVILGSFFINPLGGMLWVMLLMMFFALPATSLFSPIFSPQWLRFIPSYHSIFALDAAIFPDSNSHIIWQGAAILAGLNLLLVPLSSLIFKKMIGRDS
ncbi:ABC transporter permease [Patescibacteria group bacterium]|nr:ABC transporter permease [Patescibacteria group bacterium]